MDVIDALLLMAGGLIALSGIIAIRRPDLKPKLDQLIAFKALIGIGLLICGIVTLSQDWKILVDSFHMSQIFAAAIWSMVAGSLLLGGLFAWPILAALVPDHSPAKPKINAITQNVEAFQVLIGAVGIVAALVFLLYRFGVLSAKGGFLDDAL